MLKGNDPSRTREDLALEAAYERIAGQQAQDVVALKAAAAAFKTVLVSLPLPLGTPCGYDRDEILAPLDEILAAPDVDDDAAWEAARLHRMDAVMDVAEYRREMREVV